MRNAVFCGSCSALVFCALVWVAAGEKETSAPAPLGINLSLLASYANEMPFANLLKVSGAWVSQVPGKPWGKGPPLDLDTDGWVRRLGEGGNFAQVLFAEEAGTVFGGKTLTCLYDGNGSIDFTDSARVTARAPGRLSMQVLRGKGPLRLSLLKTDPANPVRNIRVLEPDLEKSYPEQKFRPAFLERWGRFKVLRFMDWQATNNSPLVEWADRPSPGQRTVGGPKGTCLEYLTELANTVGADPWFCMPHRASDDFVRQFALAVKKNLKPERKVYIEYSNECWNGMFGQSKYCLEQGKKLRLSTNDFEAQLRFYSQRAVEVFRIWEEVFEGKDRLVRVLGSQAGSAFAANRILEWNAAYKRADALAIAPYFGNALGHPKFAQKTEAMSVGELLQACRASIRETRKGTALVAAQVRPRGLKLMAYEGGQHLVGVAGAENNDRLTQLFAAANRDPGMKEEYLEDQRAWRECGGDLCCFYSSMARPSKWGNWGLLEYEGQDPSAAPKYQAALAILAKTSGGK
jgi:hypothetical protein